ncbi:MAG: hypothetical protein IJT16_00125 [Lachnospiraceae bacterium]|nr:hypothetical protein [Lachnospiraceae bacterium]
MVKYGDELRMEVEMDFKEFTEQIIEALQEYLPDTFQRSDFCIQDIQKNNGVTFTGILYRGDDIRVSPIIYLRGFYDRFVKGEMEWGDILREIAGQFTTDRIPVFSELNNIRDFNIARQFVTFRLINAGKNREFLQDHPHRRIADLAIVYVLTLGEVLGTEASIQITNEMLQNWNITVEELHHIAIENSQTLFPLEASPMEDILAELTGISIMDEHSERNLGMSMAVITNKKRMYGAVAILYDGVEDKVRRILQCTDFYIIPSSIHECICIPVDKDCISVEAITQMIREVNQTQVDPEEFLSDNLYIIGENGLEVVEEDTTLDMELIAG